MLFKNLQIEDQRLQARVNDRENNIISLEISGNHLEQYGQISDDVSDQNVEEKVMEVLNEIQIHVSRSDIEACHRIGKIFKFIKKK